MPLNFMLMRAVLMVAEFAGCDEWQDAESLEWLVSFAERLVAAAVPPQEGV